MRELSVAEQQGLLQRRGLRCLLLQFWIGDELLKTVTRTSTGEVRKKHAAGTGKRA